MKGKEIDYNNLTEEQLNSWKKVSVEQELINKFLEVYNKYGHNKAYLKNIFEISGVIAGKIINRKVPFNCVIRVKKNILDYISADHSVFIKWEEERQKRIKKNRESGGNRKNLQSRKSLIDKRIDKGDAIEYVPPIILEIGKTYIVEKIPERGEEVSEKTKIKTLEEYPRLYLGVDSKGLRVCINKNDLFIKKVKVKEVKKL